MGVTAFPIVAGAQLTATGSTAAHEPGTIMAARDSSSPANWSLVQYVRTDVAINKGDSLMKDDFSSNSRVGLASTTEAVDGLAFVGIAAVTAAASGYLWMYIGGYCPFARFSSTVASADLVSLSGSTAGRLVKLNASMYRATNTNYTVPRYVAYVMTAASNASTAGGAVKIVGVWGA